jgi:hypothetical protein
LDGIGEIPMRKITTIMDALVHTLLWESRTVYHKQKPMCGMNSALPVTRRDTHASARQGGRPCPFPI